MSGVIVRTGRLATFVRMAGSPEAPPVVLLHALGDTGAAWEEVVALLAPDLRTYAVDLRGHGRTAWVGPYSLDAMVEDVRALLDALRLDRAHVVGHSLGGVVAYLLAEQHPQRTATLVLEDPPAPRPRPRSSPQRPEGDLDFDWDLVAPLVAEADEPPPHRWEDLSAITAPTLVIGGGPPSHIDQAGLAALAERIPAAAFTTIPVGHEIHRERPAEVAALVLAHVGRATG
jgi:pimeloyl-ACP methyl ester carboxylesterase